MSNHRIAGNFTKIVHFKGLEMNQSQYDASPRRVFDALFLARSAHRIEQIHKGIAGFNR